MMCFPASIGLVGPGLGVPANDPYWTSVSCLLHFDGANGSTTFTDQKGKTFTRVGNTQISTAQYMFGGASGLFDGSGDNINAPQNADFQFGTGDFTVECWIRTSVKDCVISDLRVNPNTGIVFYTKATTGYLGAFANVGSMVEVLGTTNVCDGNWHHVAFVRVSGTLSIYLDGVLNGSGAMANNLNQPSACYIGSSNGTTLSWNGYIDEFRITKGVGRYTAGFTPTGPFPNS